MGDTVEGTLIRVFTGLGDGHCLSFATMPFIFPFTTTVLPILTDVLCTLAVTTSTTYIHTYMKNTVHTYIREYINYRETKRNSKFSTDSPL